MIFQVALKSGELVVHTDTVEAESANAAIEEARKFAQLPYNFAEAYDYYDDDVDAEPILAKPCHAEHGHFRKIV